MAGFECFKRQQKKICKEGLYNSVTVIFQLYPIFSLRKKK